MALKFMKDLYSAMINMLSDSVHDAEMESRTNVTIPIKLAEDMLEILSHPETKNLVNNEGIRRYLTKPCPFCGGLPEPEVVSEYGTKRYIVLKCQKCRASTRPFDTKFPQYAYEAWNDRI